MNKEYEIYYEAFDIADAEDRKNFILEKCGGDQKLFEHIMKLFPEETLDQDVYGKYEIESEIGRGGMGVVYLASYTEKFESETFTRKVALKTISPEQKLDTKSIKKLLLEIKTLAELEHPFIARFLDIGTSENGKPFFVMEYIDGLPINEYCDKNKLSVKERLEFFRKVLDAIEFSHRKGFIHCDIKPNNILVDSHGSPKVIDFGIASKYGAFISDENFHTTFLKNAFTVNYASPEQIKGEQNLSQTTDVYSLGVVLYQLLTGKLPIDFAQTASYQQLINTAETRQPTNLKKSVTNVYNDEEREKIANERDCQTIAELKDNLPNDLDEIIQKAIAKKRTKRYKSVKDFDAEIEIFLYEESFFVQLKRAFSLLYKRTTRRLKRIPLKWAFASILCLSIAFGALSQNTAFRTIPYYLKLKFSENNQQINLSETQKQALDKSIRGLTESLSKNLNEASLQLEKGIINEKHNAWGFADLVSALSTTNHPLDKNRLNTIFDQLATSEGCWKEEKVDCKLAVSGWIMISKARLGKPASSQQLEFILKNQNAEGWFPAYPYPEKSESAATYPTAIVALGLTEQLESNLISVDHRERVKAAIEKSVVWMLNSRDKTGSTFLWSDCPKSLPVSQTRSYGLDGIIVYALHNIEKSNLVQIENFAGELKAIDSAWLTNLQNMPAFSLEDSAECRCATFAGNEVILDRTVQWTPWSIAATVEAFPNGNLWQKAAALRWLENLPLSAEYKGYYYGASEYLMSLSYTSKHI